MSIQALPAPRRSCAECGTRYTPTRADQRYRSRACRNRSRSRKARQRRDTQRLAHRRTHCANPDCGARLTGPQISHGDRCCSPACRAASTPPGKEAAA